MIQLLRKRLFWTLDYFKGRSVKKHYVDIENIMRNHTSQGSADFSKKYLSDILTHTIDTVPYYTGKVLEELTQFPVINKNMIRDHFEAFISKAYIQRDCVKVSTSGSTGAPFSVLHDRNKRKRSLADNLFFSKASGYQIGNKLVYIKIWKDNVKVHLLSKNWMQNVYPVSVFNLEDIHIASFIKWLEKDPSKKSFLGYASALEKICKYLDRHGAAAIKANVQSIITMSESLNDYTKQSLEKYFGVQPLSRYSNNENGILAQESFDKKGFVINKASYHIEILDMKTDKPVGMGERGRIIVTDLHNYAMPLIRYDTGDVGAMNLDEEGNPYIMYIQGRKLDLIYDTKGKLVPSHVSYKLCKYGDYKQFQLVQYGIKDYLIKLNTTKKVDEEKMKEEYKEYFGKDAKITIEYVNDIPLLSSGKRREVRNTYYSEV
ncbi:phenylacetate--CoA ligase family protein [Aquimarina sp. TRL1]|uniref:phenylacetate--CoA ligase family protein n=1 Tax=Aquimarina sp. (strain TRL1) TaxID=2736252 RepID=UPI00158E9EDB|nr:phenylacetate--CoA ligase family protein [Aquimarina sp. TRL1]QKX07242.1 phenylacetate--CoA ligase family protein [Aquimarina sp. TRL1]